MSLDILALGYVGIGLAIAVGIAVTRGVPAVSDALLLVGLWPLWAPLVIAQRAGDGDQERVLLGALARAKTSPLAQILPDAETARVLAGRVREATQRLADL
ncbi:MAG: hypothetical protein H0T89_13365, partial [Deltaproteobacteria bacterium]|nr:hypothetical protein [Deltaproteobacteria bacterium]